ncbi:PIR protein [Plasmodium sp. DRC-Itaito]|nr:PIR protein [Plasmodium sp. DRC-Itaito]
MKVHYIKIFLFAHALNILVNTHKKNTFITPRHTQTNRSLCECELYTPANYDSDPEMKKIMQQFEDRTSQRFHEYDERMVEKRKQCKDQCDKEIQKIILKDKLEKQMAEKFATLDTDIQRDAIPTCICEKSIADKVEKGCLRCGGVLGGGVAPGVGILGGIGEAVMSAWKFGALETAARYAMKEGAVVGKFYGDIAGMHVVTGGLKKLFFTEKLGINSLESYFTTKYHMNIQTLAQALYDQRQVMCGTSSILDTTTCDQIGLRLGTSPKFYPTAPPDSSPIVQRLEQFAIKVEEAADFITKNTSKTVTDILKRQQTSEIATTYGSCQTAITASIIAIVVIVLIMIIIYLILRYRRKKKMKRKLQYIKLLEE